MFGLYRKARQQTPRRRLELEALESRELPSVTVIESEPNDKWNGSKFFTLPTDDGTVFLQGTAINKRDRDYFAFTVTGSTTLNVQVGTTNGVLAKLIIEDSLDNRVFATRPREGIHSGSAPVVAGRTYFVQLRTKGTNAAAYDVTLALTDPSAGGGGSGGGGGANPIQETETNDRRPAADPFQFASGEAQLLGTSVSHGDRDYFVFTASQDGTLSFTVEALNGVFAQLKIEDLQGDELAVTQPGDGINSGNLAVRAGKSYFIRLRAPATAAANYQANLMLG